MKLSTDRWIGVFAHPDDEWLAGWPIFQRTDLTLGAIFFVGNNRTVTRTDNNGLPWKTGLVRVLDQLGVQLLGCLDCAPNFYRDPRSERRVWREQLTKIFDEVRSAGPFAGAGIVTHNPVGEYGHPDHIEVNRAVLDICDVPVLVSDICDENPISERTRRLFYHSARYGPYHVDRNRWIAARTAYKTLLKWTAREWPGQETASLYEL